jgi:hypothetical protein
MKKVILIVAAATIASVAGVLQARGLIMQQPTAMYAQIIAEMPEKHARSQADMNLAAEIVANGMEVRRSGFHLVRPHSWGVPIENTMGVTSSTGIDGSPNQRFEFVPIQPVWPEQYLLPYVAHPGATMQVSTRRLFRNTAAAVMRNNTGSGWDVTAHFDARAIGILSELHGDVFVARPGPDWFGITRQTGERVTDMVAALAINDRILKPISITEIVEDGLPVTVDLAIGLSAADSLKVVEGYHAGY